MKIYLVEHDAAFLSRPELRSRSVFRRAIVATVGEEAVFSCLREALAGDEIFSGEGDRFRVSRAVGDVVVDDEYLNVLEIGETTELSYKGSRILAWEIEIPQPVG
ncbi:MAG: hypothetical protein WC992_00430 [Acholeplasmataceae bacterium]|jgi:hypothetical protein